MPKSTFPLLGRMISLLQEPQSLFDYLLNKKLRGDRTGAVGLYGQPVYIKVTELRN